MLNADEEVFNTALLAHGITIEHRHIEAVFFQFVVKPIRLLSLDDPAPFSKMERRHLYMDNIYLVELGMREIYDLHDYVRVIHDNPFFLDYIKDVDTATKPQGVMNNIGQIHFFHDLKPYLLPRFPAGLYSWVEESKTAYVGYDEKRALLSAVVRAPRPVIEEFLIQRGLPVRIEKKGAVCEGVVFDENGEWMIINSHFDFPKQGYKLNVDLVSEKILNRYRKKKLRLLGGE